MPCPECRADPGVCGRCGGFRDDPDWNPGDDPDDRLCFACDGTGTCDSCNPDGQTTLMVNISNI